MRSGLHVAYYMTARKYILRLDNQPGTASNISVFVSGPLYGQLLAR